MYAYAANNPVKYTDPDGNSPINSYAKYDSYGRELAKGPDINLNPQNKESQYAQAESHIRYKADFVVAGHGNRMAMYKYSGYSKDSKDRGVPTPIPAKSLASMIKSHKNYKEGMSVILWSCDVGKAPDNKGYKNDCYAQQLADELGEGSVVLAPSGEITVGVGTNPNKIINKDGSKGQMNKFIGRSKNEEW